MIVGSRVTLSYQVDDASTVTVRAMPGGTLLDSSTDVSGAVTSEPIMAPTRFSLLATSEGGDAQASVMVEVDTSSVAIISFSADPSPGAVDGQTTLSWTTAGAERVRVLQATNTLLDSETMAAAGSLSVQLTATTTRFVLEAVRGFRSVSREIEVDAVPIPSIHSFTATPETFERTPATITIAWDTSAAESVSLSANGVDVASFPATARGSIVQQVSESTSYLLVAANGAGTVQATQVVSGIGEESEPNNNPNAASNASGGPLLAAIQPADDRDWFSVAVPEGGSLYVQTSDGRGGCEVATSIQILAPDGQTKVAEDNGGGPPTGCSQIDPRLLTTVRNLPAGRYTIEVRGNGTDTGDYLLTVRAAGATCGNGVIETVTAEQCDDANLVSGDGCSASCRVESASMLSGPGMSTTVGGSISRPGETDVYSLLMSAPGSVRVRLFAPAEPSCAFPGELMTLTLFDASGDVLGRGVSAAAGECATIEPRSDPFARLPAGIFFVHLASSNPAITIAAYRMQVETLPVGCGNGVLDPAEICDDGNTTDGDGCNATCRFEGMNEVEPNGTHIDATSIAQVPVVINGAITPDTEEDYFAVTIPSGSNLEAWVTAGSLESCNIPGTVRLTLLDTNGTTVLAADTFSGPSGRCGRLAPDTSAATIGSNGARRFLRISAGVGGVGAAQYYLHVRAAGPGCGNRVRETGEECDDGNTSPNDGCSASCGLEVAQTFNPPGGSRSIDLSNTSGFAAVRIVLDEAGQSIEADTSDGAGACPVDTKLTLLDSGLAALGASADGGPFPCAAIATGFDGYARDLAPGAYFLLIDNEGSTGGTAQLDVRVVDPQCGDGIVQTRAGERCDDRNVQNGDGCNSNCRFEASVLPETASNDSLGQATASGATRTSTTIIAAGIDPIRDTDFFSFTVPPGASATVIARTFGALGDPQSCSGDTVMALLNASGNALVEDDNGNGLCSSIDGRRNSAAANLAPGLYFLRVAAFMDFATIPQYFLSVELQ